MKVEVVKISNGFCNRAHIDTEKSMDELVKWMNDPRGFVTTTPSDPKAERIIILEDDNGYERRSFFIKKIVNKVDKKSVATKLYERESYKPVIKHIEL